MRSPTSTRAAGALGPEMRLPSRIPRPVALAPAWSGVWLLAVAHLLAFADRFIAALVAPAIKADLHLSDFEVGLAQGTAFVGAYAAASLLAGPVVDRVHRPRLIAAGILVWSLASLACGLATDLGEFVLARLGLGLGQAALTPAALSLIAARQPRDQIGRGVSVYTAGAVLGRGTALVLGGGLLALLPAAMPLFGGSVAAWRVLFLLSVLPNLVVMAGLLRMADPGRGGTRAPVRLRLGPWLARHAGRYAAITVAGAAVTLVVQTTNAWAVTLLVRRFGLPLSSAGMLFGCIVALAAPLGQVAGGRLLDRAGSGALPGGRLLLGALLGTLPLATILCLTDNLALALSALAALVFGLGIGSVATLAGLQIMTPRPLRGRVTAPFMACVTLMGFGLGPPLVGLLADRVFGEAGLGPALLTTSLAAYGVGIIALLLRPRALTSPGVGRIRTRR